MEIKSFQNMTLVSLLVIFLGYCNSLAEGSSDSINVIYHDVSSTHLPINTLGNNSMDARPADLDNDGDLDLVIAVEYLPNIILINDGNGYFTNESTERLPQKSHDSEDIGIADFDGDSDPDIIFVSEDDSVNELYFNDGAGFFSDVSDSLPVNGISNAVLAVDINNDSLPDILIGNDGQNKLLINNGNGIFVDETSQRLPANLNTTQDLEMGDVDNDGDDDLIEGNENGNRLLLNVGAGFFIEAGSEQLPLPPAGEETREADFGDVDGDGDIDIHFANVAFTYSKPAQNRLLLNDGDGNFTDVTSTSLPAEMFNSVDGDLIDIDLDGDLDILIANAFGGDFQVLLNDGSGVFTDHTNEVLSPVPVGDGVDIETADFTGDSIPDLYFCGFSQQDYLYIGDAGPTIVNEYSEQISHFELFRNYPNPFNPTTNISFEIGETKLVSLKVFNILGNEVAVLINEKKSPGLYELQFDASDLSSGIYFYRLEAGNFIKVSKMILMR